MYFFFWRNVLEFIADNVDKNVTLQWKDVLLGIVENSRDKQTHTFFIIFFILMAKFHIHKCKFSGKKSMLYSI